MASLEFDQEYVEKCVLMEPGRVVTKYDILRILHENRHRLLALGVRSIGLFGSYVRGEQHSASDIDLLVEFEADRKSFDTFMELAFWLEAILQRKVELVTAESLQPIHWPLRLERDRVCRYRRLNTCDIKHKVAYR